MSMSSSARCSRSPHATIIGALASVEVLCRRLQLLEEVKAGGRIPRYLSKKTRRQRKAIAKVKAEQDKIDGEEFGFTEGSVLGLPCEGKAYDNDTPRLDYNDCILFVQPLTEFLL